MKEFLHITPYGNNILRKKAEPVKDVDDKLIALVENMFEAMHNANGIGLAAPQVNVSKALFIMDLNDTDDYRKADPIIMINPKIMGKEGEVLLEEGCLSIPNIRAKILRPQTVFVQYRDLNMKEQELEAEGLLARVIQHETDHLLGKLFIDYLDPKEKKRIKEDLLKIKHGEIDPDYPMLYNNIM